MSKKKEEYWKQLEIKFNDIERQNTAIRNYNEELKREVNDYRERFGRLKRAYLKVLDEMWGS